MKKKLLLTGTVAALTLVLGACGTSNNAKDDKSSTKANDKVKLKFDALLSGYGEQMWPAIVEAYKTVNPNVEIDLAQSKDKELNTALSSEFAAKKAPDIVMYQLNKETPKGLVQDKKLADLSDVLSMQVPGESVKVQDKIEEQFLNNTIVKPFGKELVALPMFQSPTGLFYSKSLFKEKGWEVPKTWEELFALGEKAKADGISLFTIAAPGYMDSFWPATLASEGGVSAFDDVINYKEGAWSTPAATKAFEYAGKLAKGTHTDVAANGKNFTANQQLLIDKKALFMPNGTWVVDEMKNTTPKDFEWGMMAYPAAKEGGDRYAFSFFEQIWVPSEAKHVKEAKEFLAFLYSEKAMEIFAKYSAVQPVKDYKFYDKLSAEKQIFNNVYKEGAKAIVGGFKQTTPIEGVNMKDSLYKTFLSVANDSKTVEDWQKLVVETNDKLRAALPK